VRHDSILADFQAGAAIAYTDGSALDNPGPSGAGVTLFFSNPDIILDAGVSLGTNSNNFAELVALFVCFSVLLSSLSRLCLNKVVVFSDSVYAIQHLTSVKTPRTHTKLTIATRDLLKQLRASLSVELHWVRGHIAMVETPASTPLHAASL
jgi:ribonuclease HI